MELNLKILLSGAEQNINNDHKKPLKTLNLDMGTRWRIVQAKKKKGKGVNEIGK